MSGTQGPLDFAPDVDGYILCIAKSDRDQDMQGYAVRLSIFIVNICTAILITWSEEEVKSSVGVTMLQVYTILLCSFVSVLRGDLSISDAHFAVSLTLSPLSIYFMYSTYRFLRKRPNHLYARLGSSRLIVCILSFLLLTWWIVFEILIYFGNIYKGADCPVTFTGFVLYRMVTGLFTFFFSFVLMPLFPIFWIIYFLRHLGDIREEHRRHMHKERPLWNNVRWLQTIGLKVKYFIIAQWDVITRSHKWLFFLFILIFYVSWAGTLLIWAVDINEWYHFVVLEVYFPDQKYEQPKDFNPLSYGQLLAAAVAIEPVYGVLKLLFLRRRDALGWVKQWPPSIWNGVVFIFTGRRNPWKKVVEKQRSTDSADYKNLLHPEVRQSDGLPLSRETLYEESDQGHFVGNESKAHISFSRSASPTYVNPYDPSSSYYSLPYKEETGQLYDPPSGHRKNDSYA